MVTLVLILLNFAAFLLTISAIRSESPELSQARLHIRLLAKINPQLLLPPAAQQLVDRSHPGMASQTLQPARRTALQQEMNNLAAQYAALRAHLPLQRYAFVPEHPTWYSYVTATFLHSGWLHLLADMWFLWLAGLVLEDVWGRGLFLAVYLAGGAFALQVHAFSNPDSNIATLGASGAVAALMGAFLVRFPKVRIRMRGPRTQFSVKAYWLLPLWFALEIFSGILAGRSSGVAHMAHVGGFCFGVLAAFVIHGSGLERTIPKAAEAELDENDTELDGIEQLIAQGSVEEALSRLDAHKPEASGRSERALLLEQEIHWARNDMPAYIKTTQQLCDFHLGIHADDAALKDYENLAGVGGLPLPEESWFKLCLAFEHREDYERALSGYQELAAKHRDSRLGLLALVAGARLAANKLYRPQLALNLYEALAQSPVPHLDLEGSIELGISEARVALARSAAASTPTVKPLETPAN